MKLTLLMLAYAHSALILLIISISFSFNLFLGECNAGGLEEVAQHSEKFLKQSSQQHVDKQTLSNMKIQGSKDVRSFHLVAISVYMFVNCTALRVWKGKGITGPDEINTRF